MIKKMNRYDLGFKSLTAYTVLYNIHTYKSRERFIYKIKMVSLSLNYYCKNVVLQADTLPDT